MQSDSAKFKEEFTKRLIRFSLQTIELCGKLREKRLLLPIADQLIRSATSVGANVVEAKSSSSRKDYIHFFEIALKSANETKYWLMLVKESIPDFIEKADTLLSETSEISNILASSILTLKGKK
ncbi:MAG: four helix bundle protein [bacterium]|nr:four helix bundle protein [bacterium]